MASCSSHRNSYGSERQVSKLEFLKAVSIFVTLKRYVSVEMQHLRTKITEESQYSILAKGKVSAFLVRR